MRDVVFIMGNINRKGGIVRATSLIANNLANFEKYNIKIISLTKQNEELYYKFNAGITIDSCNINEFSIRDTFFAAKELKSMFDKNFDGIIIADDTYISLPIFFGLFFKCRKALYYCWSHGNFFRGRLFGPGWLAKQVSKFFFDKIIVLTKEDKEYYEKSFHRAFITQIYNPIPQEKSISSYNRFSNKIISCGSLNKIKGFDILVTVADKVFSEINNWTWDIYGEGPEKEFLQNQINKLGLADRVFLKGQISNLYDKYKEYGLSVMTSKEEGLPMVMIEAMSNHLPVVSFDFKCGPKDLIENNVNGYVVANGDQNAMASKIVELILDDEKRISFSKNTNKNLYALQPEQVMKRWNYELDNCRRKL